ncbi:tryptophan halogenase family protein [Pseudoduganella plicata]|uniref:Tryptophan 7-halogenase n=1 Tax=Pseudoduganella plicata TaxID=321984 RepID=A0A4P7BHH5_9BURK|nr:tryptophan halogenase family protein [Pseudoduganella plicata]QBQ37547.1 tryptophan 7-halogenase [Pseudoduganella plicata]GGY91173.1 tryptophan halogenase [Pseudoduganella plicata]
MVQAIRRIVIVGGGSAGWLTAGMIAADHQAASPHGLQVTLIESPDVAPIGVGEGTWPSMRDTLRRIGVPETAFFRECDAAFKQGSLFRGWREPAGDDYYFHPFVLPQGYGEADLVGPWQAAYAQVPFADLVSFQPHLCAKGRAPKQPGTPEYAAVANYGYHLDAGKFGVFLRKHCLERLGVRYVPDHVTGIASHDNGDIAALHTREHGALAGDLFIDCTGMQSLLLGRHFDIPVISQRHVLFNDSALAVQVPYQSDDSPIASQTTSTAQRTGWIWDIGLPTRRGIGHVYSSAHTSDAQAEADLRAYVGSEGMPTPRKLTFEPGYRREFWHRNCVAIGLSAGFIEPLEASALALVEMSAALVSDDLPATRADMDVVARRFNDAFTYRWERVVEFLKLHYVLSRRDGAYWEDNRSENTIPERLRELLALWRHRPPSRLDFHRIEEVFPSASWQYVLYGMGFVPAPGGTRRADPEAAAHYYREAADLTRRMLGALPSNRELLEHIRRHGLQKI